MMIKTMSKSLGSRPVRKLTFLAIMLVVLAGLSACGEKTDNSPADSRLIIVGFDGMEMDGCWCAAQLQQIG